MTFTTVVLWIHLAAIALWVGGLFAVPMVVTSVIRGEMDDPRAAVRLMAAALGRFQRISREIIFLIFLSGLFNIINAGVPREFDFGARYLGELGTKVLFFVALIAIQMWQSYRLIPRAAANIAAMGRNDAAASALSLLQRRLLVTSLVSVVLAIAAIFLGLRLRYA